MVLLTFKGSAPNRRLAAMALLASVALTACTTPEMKMTPAASAGVGVRFAQGEAIMVSAGERGAVALRPIRYNGETRRVLFVVAGFNRSDVPINFGTENLSIRLDTSLPMPIDDFDGLYHNAKLQADRARTLAFVKAAASAYGAYGVGRRHPAEGRALMQDAIDAYDDQLHSIGDTLVHRVDTASRVLQTTTIDPQTSWAGWIVADQPPLANGEVRRMSVDVSFAGETHHFALFLAPEGVQAPPQVSLPAVTRADGETMLYRTPPTWLWSLPATSTEVQAAQHTWVVSRF